MTFRLVALMSVVLLLSLAAFGLLMGHYQDQVMQEVARTASTVGKAALRTLEPDGNPPALRRFPADDEQGQPVYWTERLDLLKEPGAETGPVERIVMVEAQGTGRKVVERTRFVSSPTGAAVGGMHPIDGEFSAEARRLLCDGPDADAGTAGVARVFEEETANFFIDVEDVRVESDEGHLTLKIPRFTSKGEDAVPSERFEYLFETSDDPSTAVVLAKHDELHLPIPVEEYSALFDSIRGRSLYLFLGVFLVGTALSAGLASRFTRPIRRLDAAIHRLSDGDLDAEVQVRGKDETARLSRAFNEMTRRLREGRERSREVVRREKLSALGGLAAGVAHDVRNPLHSIGLTLQHLRETCRPEDNDRAAEFDRALGIIRGEIRRLDQLVGNFLNFAKNDTSERGPVDLAGLLEETARLISKEAEWRKIEVELDVNATTPSVVADGEAVRSSILNLVLNSFEAMPDGGVLTLALGVEGRSVVVEVADTGRGIPEEQQEKVFEFAYTTREGGNGLGLAMVHHCIVEQHGGRVSLDSRPGEGARVRLALPIRIDAGEPVS